MDVKRCEAYYAGATLAAMIVMTPMPAVAGPVFGSSYVPDGATEVGYWTWQGPRSFSYDHLSDLMSYSVGLGQFRVDAPFGTTVGLFDGSFQWSATVNEFGEVSSGLARLFLDFGSGLEEAATGTVIDFGLRSGNVYCDPQKCIFDVPQVSIATSFVDPRVASVLGNFWQWSGSIQIYQTEPYLLESFACDGGSMGPEVGCDWFSHDYMYAYEVDEPSAGVLLGIGLLGLVLSRRRRLN